MFVVRILRNINTLCSIILKRAVYLTTALCYHREVLQGLEVQLLLFLIHSLIEREQSPSIYGRIRPEEKVLPPPPPPTPPENCELDRRFYRTQGLSRHLSRDLLLACYFVFSCLLKYSQFSASVVQWSEFLATDTEVSDSIPGATRFSEQQWVWNGIHSAS